MHRLLEDVNRVELVIGGRSEEAVEEGTDKGHVENGMLGGEISLADGPAYYPGDEEEEEVEDQSLKKAQGRLRCPPGLIQKKEDIAHHAPNQEEPKAAEKVRGR